MRTHGRKMFFIQEATVLLCIILFPGNAIHVEEVKNSLSVTISRGALVTPREDVVLFTESDFLMFTIPDLPEPPAISSSDCSEGADEESCLIYSNLQSGVKDVSDLLGVINRVLTTKGLNDVLPQNLEIPQDWIRTVGSVNGPAIPPSPDLIQAAGETWFSDTETRLTLRKLLSKGPDALNKRERRSLQRIIKPTLKIVKLLAAGDVGEIFKKLFVDNNSILSYLTSYKAISKDEYKVFADLSKRVSELQTETKRLFLEVLNSTEIVKQVAQDVQTEIKDHAYKLATIEESFLKEQNTLSDIVRSLYTSVVYSMHFAAYDECRSSMIPVAFLPPRLLHQRLLEVEATMPEHLKFAVPVDEYQKYYRLPIAECLFDSNGGVIRISVPFVEKAANMKLFEFKTLHFGHDDMTCALSTPSSYIVKDVKNNRIFAITEIDEGTCQPATTGMCRVPFATADDSSNFCASVLLSGEPASTVKGSCRLQCFNDLRPMISQITDSTFIGVHLPSTGIRMECPNDIIHLEEAVPHGSVRFVGSCNCRIMHGNRTMAKTTLKLCDDTEKPRMDILMPIQMTTFNDLLPFTDDGLDSTVFSNADEIFDDDFEAVAQTFEDSTETPFRVTTFCWNFLQSLFMAYLHLRINTVAGTILAYNLPAVRAATVHQCEIPTEAYFLLISILCVSILALIPNVLRKLCSVCKNNYNEQVMMHAQRIVAENDV